LTLKKDRIQTRLFLVEGEKNIFELLHSNLEIVTLLCTKPFLNIIRTEIHSYEKDNSPVVCTEVSERVLKSTGTFITNNTGIAVVRQKTAPSVGDIISQAQKNIVLILDDIRDPGNLGTIIRTANWYGVTHIVASPTTTDFYNPKVIAASMGSFTRVNITYVELTTIFDEAHTYEIPLIATSLDGTNIHEQPLPETGFLVMGSESHGISNEGIQKATHTVTIPRFGDAESLNVSVATGILLDTLRRGSGRSELLLP
jgi:TrmH family RNA methyltransferase